ncbi:MAG: hypothetical protein LBF97_01565 [Elusimicrobiota bacterium]|jgi:hypothetical protein|nr:hypothetical protein [Elusimicrobiota bacterium]
MAYENILEVTTDDRCLVKCPYLKVYIPDSYFLHRIAEFIGSDIETFGLFYFDAYGTDSTKYNEEDPFKHPKRYLYTLPTSIHMCPSDIYEERDEKKKLRHVLEFIQGDMFIKNINAIEDWKKVSSLLHLLISGFIPNELEYNEILSFINESLRINKTDFGVADTVLEILIAEISRDKDDPMKPFRFTIRDNPSIKMTDRKSVKIDNLGRLTNTFAGISSADPKQGVTTAITRARNNIPEKVSTMEETLADV